MSLLVGVIGWLAYFLASLTALRLFPRHPATVVLGVAMPVYIATVIAALTVNQQVSFWAMSAAYWCPILCFLMAFGAIYKSISLRILLYLLESPNRLAGYSNVVETYINDESFESRLRVIRENRFAREMEHGYALTRRGRRVAQLVRCLQSIFAIERSG